jgi:uncharacterized protein YhhL (DUF1145 family)
MAHCSAHKFRYSKLDGRKRGVQIAWYGVHVNMTTPYSKTLGSALNVSGGVFTCFYHLELVGGEDVYKLTFVFKKKTILFLSE